MALVFTFYHTMRVPFVAAPHRIYGMDTERC